jgi:putative ABC transport system substrate-binding protein
MVGSGLVNSLARPGGNTTGTSIFATELDGKRQEILIEAVPEIRRMAVLVDSNATGSRELKALQDAARARGVELSIHQIASAQEITAAIDAAKAWGAAALNVLSSPFLYGNRQIVMQQVAALRLPAMYQFPEEAEEGGFVAYGPSIVQIFREAIDQAGRQPVSRLQARRYSRRAADQIRAGDQPQDRQRIGHHRARYISGTRRQGNRIEVGAPA